MRVSQFVGGLLVIDVTIKLIDFIPGEYQYYTLYFLLLSTMGSALLESHTTPITIETDKKDKATAPTPNNSPILGNNPAPPRLPRFNYEPDVGDSI
jgi:hypothetical protein